MKPSLIFLKIQLISVGKYTKSMLNNKPTHISGGLNI